MLDVASGATHNGAKIHQWSDNGTNAQRFILTAPNTSSTPTQPKITASLPRTIYNAGEPITLSWVTEGAVNQQFGITVRKEPYGPSSADDVEVKKFCQR